MNAENVLQIIEMYLEAEFEDLTKKLNNIRKIRTQYVSQELCSKIDLPSESDKKEMIQALLEEIKSS